MSTISFFSFGIKQSDNSVNFTVDEFISGAINGKWQDEVIYYRTGKMEKEKLPYVTISGEFRERNLSSLIAHSGYIAIDCDDVDNINDMQQSLRFDPYVYASLRSVSSNGLCIIFKIRGEKHAESFEGISNYIFEKYGLISDIVCKDVTRARFVTWDPDGIFNPQAKKFDLLPKPKPVRKLPKFAHCDDDFARLVQEIEERGINICESYSDWLKIGFSIAIKFGEAGRDAFHRVSSISGKYDQRKCDRQYDNCNRAISYGKTLVTISSFYYACSNAGLSIYSEKTRLIVGAAINARAGGRSWETAVSSIDKFFGIPAEDSTSIVQQVYENNITEIPDESLMAKVEQFVRFESQIRLNLITGKYENDGKEMTTESFNGLYVKMKKQIDKATFEMMEKLIRSDATPAYNPIHEYFEHNKDQYTEKGLIEKLFLTIETDDSDIAIYFGKKWLVGLIATIFRKPGRLFLLLAGNAQNTGKTEWFRQLLPESLRSYYAEAQLNGGPNDDRLMCQKVLIMDDEYSGKSKSDELKLKALTSKDKFDIRLPYARDMVTLYRIAGLGGTSNETEVLNDYTGNSRIIPIIVHSINHDLYNQINKDALFIEAYWLFKEGFAHKLNKEETAILNNATGDKFDKVSVEYELIMKNFRPFEPGKDGDNIRLCATSTDIAHILQSTTTLKVSPDKIGRDMKRLGYNQVIRKVGGRTCRIYDVVQLFPLGPTNPYTKPV